MTGPLVLVVEDEERIAEVLEAYLHRDGFRTARAMDGPSAVELHRRMRPALVLLDVRLPGFDGFEVLRRIGSVATTPVIMVTARDEEVDVLVALRMGADDYVVKPYSPAMVVARVHAVLRRSAGDDPPAPPRPAGARPDRSAAAPEVLRVGALEVDVAGTAVRVRGAPLDLTATEYRLLEHLARSPHRTFTRKQLLEAALPESAALERVVDAHLGNLRRKLTAAAAPDLLQTVRGMGYRLRAGD